LAEAARTEDCKQSLHDYRGIQYGGWAFTLDEGSSGVLVQSNVVYRTTHGGFHQHYAKRIWFRTISSLPRAIINSANATRAACQFQLPNQHRLFDKGALLRESWSGETYRMDLNIYCDVRPGPIRFAEGTFEKWRERGTI